jgi:hypothetical protein
MSPLPQPNLPQDFEGPGMVSTVDQVLGMTINGDEGEEVTFIDSGIPSPYLQVRVTPIPFPPVHLLSLYRVLPTMSSVLAQCV